MAQDGVQDQPFGPPVGAVPDKNILFLFTFMSGIDYYNILVWYYELWMEVDRVEFCVPTVYMDGYVQETTSILFLIRVFLYVRTYDMY